MKKELKDLFDKKGKIVKEMEDTLSEVKKRDGGLATKEEREKFDKWDADLEEVNEQIKFHQRAEKLANEKEAREAVEEESNENPNKEFNNAATPAERREALSKARKGQTLSKQERIIVDTDVRDTKVFENYLRYGFGALSKEERDIMGLYKEKRTQTKGTTTEGGFTVPEGFSGRIIEHMKFISDLLNFVDILNTETGIDIPHPINDDTSNTGELIAESGDYSSSSDDLVFSNYTLKAYKFSSKMIKVSEELLQDNGVNLVDYLAKKLAERVARITNTYFTTGTGSAQPQGYLASSAAARGTVTASTSTWTLAELQALADSVDPAYQANAAFAAHQNLVSELKQLAIATPNFGSVWSPSFRDGEPDRILGKRYFMNQAMSSTSATGDKVWAYGDFSKYVVRMVNGFALRRLNERYAENGHVAFFGVMRADGFLSDTSSIKYMDIS